MKPEEKVDFAVLNTAWDPEKNALMHWKALRIDVTTSHFAGIISCVKNDPFAIFNSDLKFNLVAHFKQFRHAQ